jgi:amidase
VDAMPDYLPVVHYPRTPGSFPPPEENTHNAWYVKTAIKGAASGPLHGKRIAVKDNVMVAGVPMMNGCSILEGYVPEIDATVVQRILDAGGSSAGSGVVVALGEADMALGGDQGGAIRIPACWCGIYGMKPTHGLVSYTGIMLIEIFVDHTGPMTRTVTDNALLLEVIAGPDGYDPRQYAPRVQSYTDGLERGVHGMRIALIREGFGRSESEPAVDEKVRQGAELFKKLGATVAEVSIPITCSARPCGRPSAWRASPRP